jgi:hypothetical protein
MTHNTNRLWRIALWLATGAVCLLLNDNLSLTNPQPLAASAEARIGRPLTPMSYAGVARRTTRRAVVGGAPVGTAAAGAYYGGYGAGCVQVTNAYGQIVTQCR